MSQSKQVIDQLIASLQGVTDEESIKKLTIGAWKELRALIPNDNTFRKTRSALRSAIKAAFPASKTTKLGYYFTSEGKNEDERYQHLALWYATTNEDRWSVVGDVARKNYFDNLPELPTKKTEKTEPQPQPQQPTLTIKDMTLQSLELDAETQLIVQNALNHSGMNLADFVKQACKVYAKTVMGKAKQADTDLSNISTSELLNNQKYRTLPGRAEELTERAIQAMMQYNDMATEKSQKWCITASAINALTGCKMQLIKTVVEQAKIAIDDHNTKHDLDAYDNRGRATYIQKDIDLVKLSSPTEKPNVVPQPAPQPTPEATKQPTPQPTPVKPKATSTAKVIALSLTASTIDIHDALKSNPNCKVRTRDGRKALTYVLTDKGVLIEETGQIEKLLA